MSQDIHHHVSEVQCPHAATVCQTTRRVICLPSNSSGRFQDTTQYSSDLHTREEVYNVTCRSWAWYQYSSHTLLKQPSGGPHTYIPTARHCTQLTLINTPRCRLAPWEEIRVIQPEGKAKGYPYASSHAVARICSRASGLLKDYT
jgi:hypothetical protein